MPELSRYQARKEAGLCTMCGSEPHEPDRSRCEGCRKKMARAERQRRADRLARGRCPTCGERPPAKGRRDCRQCLDRYAAYQRGRS